MTNRPVTNPWQEPAQLLRPSTIPDAGVHVLVHGGCVALAGADALAVAEGARPDDLFLGEADGRTWFARRTESDEGLVSLRDVGHLLSPLDLELAMTAVALEAWHARARHCTLCGSVTIPAVGGWSTTCADCGHEHFPRTDPAVIVAITDDQDRLLLAHQAAWGQGRVSILAGFVEAGESLEQAVHREVFEESGVRLAEVAYVASQPWPFPRSLMLGFRARAVPGDVQVDGVELAWGDWFTRDAVRDRVAAGTLSLPGHTSVARRLVEAWLDGSLHP